MTQGCRCPVPKSFSPGYHTVPGPPSWWEPAHRPRIEKLISDHILPALKPRIPSAGSTAPYRETLPQFPLPSPAPAQQDIQTPQKFSRQAPGFPTFCICSAPHPPAGWVFPLDVNMKIPVLILRSLQENHQSTPRSQEMTPSSVSAHSLSASLKEPVDSLAGLRSLGSPHPNWAWHPPQNHSSSPDPHHPQSHQAQPPGTILV